jgi:hypothetical protein
MFNYSAESKHTTGILTASGTPVITQEAGRNNAFIIGPNITIHLAGTDTTKAGQITLKGDASFPSILAFYSNTSKVLAGAGTGGSAIAGTKNLSIGGKSIITSGLSSGASGLSKEDFQNADGKLVQLGGSKSGYISPSTTATGDVEINSTVAAAGTT